MTDEPDGPTSGLPPEAKKIIREEEELAETVQQALVEARRRSPRAKHRLQEYLSSRSEAVTAKEGDLATALTTMHLARSQAVATQRDPLPDKVDPYFAHMTVAFKNRRREVLIGYHAFIDTRHRVTIVDWRNAPIARVFYLYREGDEFEEDFPSGTVAGRIVARRMVSFDEAGQVAAVVTPQFSLRRHRHQGWVHQGPLTDSAETAEQLGTGQAGQGTIQISALLDRAQHRLIEKGPETSLLVLGGAGCGKTTVALHRASLLMGRHRHHFPPSKVATVVPQEGLARLTQALLKELKVGAVRASTFDRWVTQQYRRVFRDCTKRLNSDPPATVISFKRHPALRAQLPAFVNQLGDEMATQLDRALGARGGVQHWWRQARAPSLLRRLNWVQRQCRKTADIDHDAAQRLFDEARQRLFEVHQDLPRFLGDALWLQAAVDAAQGELPHHGIPQMQQHVRRQLAPSTERAYAHVTAERLEALDQRGLDEGTPDELAETLDLEDYPLLFELLWLKTGRLSTPRGSGRRYQHLVVDEAQELAPLEVALLGRCKTAEGSMTIAGDEAQQVDESAWFRDWNQTVKDAGLDEVERVHLEQNYRGTQRIADFAHQILGPLAPAKPSRPTRIGGPVLCSLFENEGHRALELLERVGRLVDNEPQARVAVVTRNQECAQALHDVLRERMPLRLVEQGAFTFQPGVELTEVAQVKGLEFDYVVVPDAGETEYPDTPVARRALHVAVTRAIHQVWVGAVRRLSPLLAAGQGAIRQLG
jgi:DNA helicase-2/ATP-dependent DNA helicase PcrA